MSRSGEILCTSVCPLKKQAEAGASGRVGGVLHFGDIAQTARTANDLYRIATGIDGTFGDGWQYGFDATNTGYLNIEGLTNAIENGTYNFADPSQNSQAMLDSISPAVSTTARLMPRRKFPASRGGAHIGQDCCLYSTQSVSFSLQRCGKSQLKPESRLYTAARALHPAQSCLWRSQRRLKGLGTYR